MRLVLRELLMLAAMGLALGLLAALSATRFVASFLFGVQPNDPLSVAAAVMVLVSAALVAGYVPARKASRMDPMDALRNE